MRKTLAFVGLMLLAAMAISAVPGKTSGNQDQKVGEFVDVAPLKQGDWETPPGHYGLLALYADSFLSAAPSIGSYQVNWNFVQPDLSDYFIVDVRPSAAYCTSHIIGAINIPYAKVAKPYNLDKLPIDKPILVYCGTGLTSSQVGPLLGMMGYQIRILITPFGSVPAEYKEPC